MKLQSLLFASLVTIGLSSSAFAGDECCPKKKAAQQAAVQKAADCKIDKDCKTVAKECHLSKDARRVVRDTVREDGKMTVVYSSRGGAVHSSSVSIQ